MFPKRIGRKASAGKYHADFRHSGESRNDEMGCGTGLV